jgi:hypothetical protein
MEPRKDGGDQNLSRGGGLLTKLMDDNLNEVGKIPLKICFEYQDVFYFRVINWLY